MQRNQEQWMSIPTSIRYVPTGLEYLAALDQLLIKQQVELFEVFTGIECNNSYKIKNALGQNVYTALEDTGWLSRHCLGARRPFEIYILDRFQNEVLHFHRPMWCCLQSVEVSSPPGTVIGTVKEECTFLRTSFVVKNTYGEIMLRIRGPMCITSCGTVDFPILTLDGDEIGLISKHWSGLVKEMFTDADNFGVNFPRDLDVHIKALLLGATFLIDMMYFEK